MFYKVACICHELLHSFISFVEIFFPNITFCKQQNYMSLFPITGNCHLELAITTYNWQLSLITGNCYL